MIRVGVLIAFLAIIKTGLCVNCYQCTSTQDSTCGDPFKFSRPAKDCSSPESTNFNTAYLTSVLPGAILKVTPGAPRYCHKVVTETGTVIRTCLDGNPTDMNYTCRFIDQASSSLNLPAKIKHCSVCDKNDCNGAGSIGASIPLVSIILVACYFFHKQ